MKVVRLILIILAALLIIALGFLGYMGMFMSMKVEEKVMGPYTIAYERYVGAYKETGNVFKEVYNKAKKAGLESSLGLGIYYDDPNIVPAEKLRSDCGVVIKKQDLVKVRSLKKIVKIKRIAKKRSIVTEFPVRNALSYMVGPLKAYSALMEYAQEKGYAMNPGYELYDEKAGKIFYYMPIEK
jgi:hypothetical protein